MPHSLIATEQSSLLQVLQAVVNHLLADVDHIVGAHRVVLIGVNHHIVLLACTVQGAAHLHSVLEVHVIVGRAVDDQQTSVVRQAVGEVDGRVIIIARGILLRETVVYLRIDRIVVTPRGYGSNRDSHLK